MRKYKFVTVPLLDKKSSVTFNLYESSLYLNIDSNDNIKAKLYIFGEKEGNAYNVDSEYVDELRQLMLSLY